MQMYDIITHKRNAEILSDEEIKYFTDNFTSGEIPDYQASALLMAIYLNGMTAKETAVLTMAMANSGDIMDLSPIPGIKVDKHSTGGVGDKTSLIIAPIAASYGVPIAKMSGRGLGHTGGTIDKMESIPGLKTTLDKESFFQTIRNTGLSIIGQSGNIAPADKKIYSLRDVTATVDSIPLIASSIMSKKIAAGSDAILLDVKTGGGAFMKTMEESVNLARAMVDIGVHIGKRMMALITDMDTPLGYAIGNSLEIIEAVNTLKGKGPEDLTEVCIELASGMLYLADKGNIDECRKMAEKALKNGKAFEKLCAMVQAQGGDTAVLKDTSLFPNAPIIEKLICPGDGIICHIDSQACGLASVRLGAGRLRLEDKIDSSAGIVLRKKVGDKVCKGDILGELHTSSQDNLREAKNLLLKAFEIGDSYKRNTKYIYARVDKNGIEML